MRRLTEHSRLALSAAFMLFFLIFSMPVRAQLSSATAGGTVTDQSGAVVANAQVTLTATATGVKRMTVTNGAGVFVFVAVDPGDYSLEILKSGFAPARQNGIKLSVGQVANFSFTLSLGSQTQEVTVSASAQQLQTSNASLGTVFNPEQVKNLPLNGRNFSQLLTLSPGASPVNTSQNGNTIAIGNATFPSVNGQVNRSNLFLLDGINDQQLFYSQYAVPPIIDAIQEFNMETHNDLSQFGGVMGAVVNVSTKSGTNEFHGDAWEFLRNDFLDASNAITGKKTPLKQNVFGGAIGGPVIAPFYNGRNHTFFFGAYEGSSINTANSTLYNVPTPEELTGDLSAIPQKIFNPYSTGAGNARTAFANNQIPSNLLDANMVKIAKAIFPQPLPQLIAGYNGLDTTPAHTMQHNYSLRIDQQISPSDQLFARFSAFHVTKTSSGGFVGLTSSSRSNGQNWVVGYVKTLGSSSTLQGQMGHTWQNFGTSSALANRSDSLIQEFGFSSNFACGYVAGPSCQLPALTITGFASGGESYALTTDTDLYEYRADYTKLFGHHMIQIGTDITPNSEQVLNANAGVNFSSFNTSDLNSQANTGSALASFLMGIPTSGNRRNLQKLIVGGWVDGFYAADQWKITPKLTVNLGLRYDMVIMPHIGGNATQTNMTGSYDMRNGTYVITKSASQLGTCAELGKAPCLPAGGLPAHVAVASNNSLIANDYDNIQPRLGIAYQLDSKRVFHLSYQRVFDTWSALLQSVQNEGALWPSVGIASVANLNTSTPSSSQTAENPLGAQASSLPAATPFVQSAYFVAPNYKNPYSDQWMVGVQQQFGNDYMFTLNYVGSVTRRLGCCYYYNTAITPGPGAVAGRNLYPYITPTAYMQNNGSSNYNGMQIKFQRQMKNGLEYAANYTWSKTIDVACDGFFGVEGCFNRDPYNPKLDRSVAGFDLPQILTVNALYKLPFGRGEQFQSGNRIVDAVVGGWQINGILSVTSGAPFTVSYSGDRANTGNIFQGVDLIGNPTLQNRNRAQWFNTAAFQTPALYTLGNAGRNILRADWFRNVDLSLFRSITVDRIRTELRLEAFNALNMPVNAAPNATLNSTTFGQISSTRSTARQIQIAGKIYF
jgi:hypothetical protein